MNNKKIKLLVLSVSLFAALPQTQASSFTLESPTSAGTLPAGVTEIGGIVSDLVGLNGTRVVSQLSASSLFEGFFSVSPGDIGTQSGFDSSVTAQLGGGIASASFRVTVLDGDTSAGEFDFNQNDFFVNGLNFGDFSDVSTRTTNSVGNDIGSSHTGFSDNGLDTGFFFSNDSSLLSSLYTSLLGSESLLFQLADEDPDDNFFDFTAGIDGGLINIGTGPVTTPPPSAVPVPAAVWLFGSGLVGLIGMKKKSAKVAAPLV